MKEAKDNLADNDTSALEAASAKATDAVGEKTELWAVQVSLSDKGFQGEELQLKNMDRIRNHCSPAISVFNIGQTFEL